MLRNQKSVVSYNLAYGQSNVVVKKIGHRRIRRERRVNRLLHGWTRNLIFCTRFINGSVGEIRGGTHLSGDCAYLCQTEGRTGNKKGLDKRRRGIAREEVEGGCCRTEGELSLLEEESSLSAGVGRSLPLLRRQPVCFQQSRSPSPFVSWSR